MYQKDLIGTLAKVGVIWRVNGGLLGELCVELTDVLITSLTNKQTK